MLLSVLVVVVVVLWLVEKIAMVSVLVMFSKTTTRQLVLVGGQGADGVGW